jgi:murein DD-endopeptidase MepM/ murein hydrolase activator NlpD
MADEASRVVVALLADTDQFDVKMRQSAASFGGNMKQIEQSARRAESTVVDASAKFGRSMGSAAQASRNLGYQISDIGTQLSSGTSPFIVLAQQGPQVANALEGARGAVGRFATFLSGPWGAAMLGAITLLGVFLTRNKETTDGVDDLVEKLKDQAQKARDSAAAAEIFGDSLEGVEAAADDARKAIELLEARQKSQEEQTVESIQRSLDNATAIREETAALLEAALAYNERFKGSLASTDPRFASEFTVAQSRIESLRDELTRSSEAADELRRRLTQAISFRTVEQANRSAEEVINDRYDAQIEGARRAAVASGKVQAELTKEIDRINAAREAELKRMRDTQRERNRTTRDTGDRTRFISPVEGGRVTGQFGEQREGRAHSGIDIAVPVGTPVKAPAGGVVIEAGNVPGYGNVIYIDHGRGTISRLAHLSQIRATKGDIVEQGQVIGLSGGARGAPGSGNSRGPHLHQEVRVGGRAVDPRGGVFNTDPGATLATAERAAEALQREIEAELRRVQAFQNELAELQGSEIDARQALITSAEELAALEVDAIALSKQRYDDNLAALAEQEKLTAEEAEQLRAINAERARLRLELVQRREDERKFRVAEADRQRAVDLQLAQIDAEAELLEGQADLARTQAERRELETRLLDLDFQAERIQNDTIIAAAERLRLSQTATEEQQKIADALAAEARLRNSTIEDRRGQGQAGVNQRTQGPLEGFFDSIPSDMAEINEALESVAAGGLATFTDALTDAIVNFRSLKDVGLATLQAVTAGLVRMAIQQVILRTIGQTLGAGAVATTTAQAATVASSWGAAAALASLATLGANAGPAAAALVGTTALAQALAAATPGRRDGGPIFGPGGPRDDKVLMRASPGEYFIKARSAAKLGRSTLDFLNQHGELPGFAMGGAVGFRPRNGTARGGGGGGATLSADAVRQLEGVVARAAEAMPDVKLYPTLDPEAAFRAMLNSPGGQRAMFDFVRQNSGKFNSSLQQ